MKHDLLAAHVFQEWDGGSRRAHPLPSGPAEGGRGHESGCQSTEEGVPASVPRRRGEQCLEPGAAACGGQALPDPGCASPSTLFVSLGHDVKSGDNDETQLTGLLWGLNELINAKVFEGCLACCQCQPSVYFQEQGLQTP